NTGDKINTIDYGQYLSGNGFINDVKYFNGKITSKVYIEDEKGGRTVEMDNDVLTGKKLDERALSESYSGFSKALFQVGDYSILAESATDQGSSSSEFYYVLTIIPSEGKEYNVQLKKERTDLFSVSVVLPLDEDRLLVPVMSTSTNIPVFFEVDLKAAKAVEVDGKDYDWIDFDRVRNTLVNKDGRAYFSTSAGISTIDMKNKKIEEFFNYNACPMNKVRLLSTEMIDCSDKEIVLLGNSISFSMEKGFTPDFEIYVITKASGNPHAGKTVLELYSTYGVEETIAEAITRFNETNKSFFVEVTDRYEFDSVKTYLSADSKDDEALDSLQTSLSLNDKLAMDIMNGTGPDILINTGDMGRLYHSNYLVDLSKYFADLDQEKYFTNIIEAAKTDGKLYQLPIRFDIEGIHTDSKYAGASGMGFTTKEYEDFLYGPLNGYDLNQTGQAFYFATLFNAMSDRFIVNGKADFSGPEFAEIAEFVKNNVHEKALSNDAEMSDERSWQNDRIARLISYTSIISYFEGVNDLQGADSFLGIPSSDGRGPMASCRISASVSAQAVNTNACIDFVKILLSDEIQYDMSKTGAFSLSREAYRKAGSIILDYCNGPRGSMAFQKTDITGKQITRTTDFTKDDLDNLEKIISSCTHFNSADASINMILIEEMPAYFLGQKDLDSVVKIAQDRAQKVLDERG
ncbi:MAG: extracellular solute-binding protein, partial [Clostridiales bacterium]|nr:extracellular solute-binding protein [Clostridiales bacterium]